MLKYRKTLILLGILGSSPVYHFVKNKHNFNQNEFIINNDFNSLKNPNLLQNSKKSDNDILVIGGGIAGVTQAFYLLNYTDRKVILIDKLGDVAEGTSNSNGCIAFCTHRFPSVNLKFLLKMMRSMIFDDNSILSMDIWHGVINYPNGLNWCLNMLLNLREKIYFENFWKLQRNFEISEEELIKINKDLIGKDFEFKGFMEVFDNEETFNVKKNIFEKYADSIKSNITEVSPEEFFERSFNSKEKLKNWENTKKCIFYKNSHMIETNEFIHKLLAKCKNYKDRFIFLSNTEFQKFIIDKKEKNVVGVLSNKGYIKAKDFFLCTGIYSNEIVSKLGYRLPILPLKGYTLTINDNKNILHKYKYPMIDEDLFFFQFLIINFELVCLIQVFLEKIMKLNQIKLNY